MSAIAVLLAGAYLLALVFVARTGESWSRTPTWSRIRPWLPGLALGVYCTTWTYYGAVGRAVEAGFAYLPIYLGPILVYVLAYPLLERIHLRSKEQSAGSIADLLALRFGRRRSVAVIATLITVLASLPYIGLQLKAVSTSLTVLAGNDSIPINVPALLAVSLGVFAGVFGTRTSETTDQRPGLVTAVAVESVVKLVALGGVALYVVGSLELSSIAPELSARGSMDEPGFWILTALSGFAVLCLPRQFHLVSVETETASDLRRARWVFPSYLLLMSAFVAPIAVAGMSLGGNPDSLVLQLPLNHGAVALSLFAFIGGVSAATAMVIVSAYAVGSMVTNEILLPLFFDLRDSVSNRRPQRLGALVVLTRRVAIFGVVMVSYIYLAAQSQSHALASFGLVAFSLIAQLSPALLLGLYWKRAHAHGAIAGMIAGIALWGLCVLAPTFYPDLPLRTWVLGLDALSPIERGSLVSLSANALVLVGVSLLARPRLVDRVQASAFVHGGGTDRYDVASRGSRAQVGDLRQLLYMFLDEEHYERLSDEYKRRAGAELMDDDDAPDWMLNDAERALGTVLGVASARDLLISLTEHRNLQIDEVFHLVGGAADALRFNRSLLYTSLDNVAYGISVIDGDLNLMAWNQRYVEFFAYPPGMVTVGRPIADLVRFNVMRSEVEEGRIEVEVKKRLEHLRRGTIYTTRRTIRSRVLELNGRPLPDGGFVTTFSDITDHVAAKDALQEANDTLEDTVEARTAEIVKINQALADAKTAAERANQEKTQFLVAVGHDILQPLSAARLFLTAALESEDRAHRTELMQKLGDSLSATEELIADLYEISKLDHGALEPDFTEVAVAQILDQLAEEVRPLAEAKGLELRYVGSQCFTRTDPSYLRRIVGNFLSNAIKYTRHGKILMGVRPVGDLLRVQVWDTGPGIPSHERSRVFEDFCRLDNARGEVGSGLGLSVVRRMARALGAEVELRSAVGKGSCFSLELPRIRIAGCRPSRVPDHPGWSGDEAQVLYVDDEYANIDALGSLVQTWGCALTGFGEVEEAMAYARAMQPPDVLIVDYQLKDGANGIEVAQRLRRSWNVTVPTLIVTALRGSDVRAKAIGCGYQFMHKPLKPAALRSILRHMLGGAHSKKTLEATSTA